MCIVLSIFLFWNGTDTFFTPLGFAIFALGTIWPCPGTACNYRQSFFLFILSELLLMLSGSLLQWCLLKCSQFLLVTAVTWRKSRGNLSNGDIHKSKNLAEVVTLSHSIFFLPSSQPSLSISLTLHFWEMPQGHKGHKDTNINPKCVLTPQHFYIYYIHNCKCLKSSLKNTKY